MIKTDDGEHLEHGIFGEVLGEPSPCFVGHGARIVKLVGQA